MLRVRGVVTVPKGCESMLEFTVEAIARMAMQSRVAMECRCYGYAPSHGQG